MAETNTAGLQENLAALQALNRLAQTIIAAPNVDTILDKAVATATGISGAAGAALMLLNPGHAETEVTSSGLFHTLVRHDAEQEHGDNTLRQLQRMLAGWIFKHRAPLLSPWLAEDDRFPGLALLGSAAFSAAGAPIVSGDEIIGALIAVKTERLVAGEIVVTMLEQIAALVAPALSRLRRMQELAEENDYYKQTLLAQQGLPGVIAKSEAMRTVFALVQRVAPNDARVLIEGESGTGKELIARVLHNHGPRREKKFLTVDCGAIPDNLLESELFGYVKGAFTGATQNRKGLLQEADGGTLFLDEINNLPLPLQAKLLRVLQEGEVRPLGSNTAQKVDVRVIAASSQNLAELVKLGSFREDLFFRLKVIILRLPPLRERSGDVPLLADHFLKKYVEVYRKSLAGFEPAAMQLMQKYHWPGNVRELEHAVEQAVVLALPQAQLITANDLPEELRSQMESSAPLEHMTNLPAAVEALEIRMIKRALAETNGNKSQAAEKLGLSRRGFLNKLERYQIEGEK
ncbi:sigma-54-dependent Fis family transcriptional regulator [candidate division KSB1 bacterium]|nr:sigma-54-dependent Fis family transcriptional regulator [candidate division KSB1 bacterium]